MYIREDNWLYQIIILIFDEAIQEKSSHSHTYIKWWLWELGSWKASLNIQTIYWIYVLLNLQQEVLPLWTSARMKE